MDLFQTKEKVRTYIKQYTLLEKGDHVLVGVSGGADSVCLLLVLKELEEEFTLKLRVLHVEHGIRGEDSLEDAAFTEKLCERLGIPFLCRQADVPRLAKERKQSLEEAAREVRYEFFREEAVKEADLIGEQKVKIAIAHHKNDIAETFLFQLVRGSGIEGLKGIVPRRGNLIRPLLCLERQEIEDCLEAEGQPYCMDVTNEDRKYARNRIRHQVLPELTLVNAHAVQHIAQSADVMADTLDYLRIQIDDAYRQCLEEDGEYLRLNVEKLDQLHVFLRAEVLRKALAEISESKKDLSSMHVDLLTALARLQTGRSFDLPYGVTAKREYDTIVMSKNTKDYYESEPVAVPFRSLGELRPGESFELQAFGIDFRISFLEELPAEELLRNKFTKYFSYDKMKNNLVIRNAREGDYLVIDQKGSRQKLNRFFINEKVPQSKRKELPLLADGDHIVWVIGYRTSEAYRVTQETRRILKVEVVDYERTY